MSKLPISSCYHTHTKRCGHAFGEDEEYVLAAIEHGYKILGFSDHAMFPGISQPGGRGDFSEIDEYISSIHSLKEKYKNQIDIYLAFEAEYLPEFKDYYASLYKKYGFDYLVLGQHAFLKDNHFCYYGSLDPEIATKKYVEAVLEALDTGYFRYFAHPDYFMTWEKVFSPRAEGASKIILNKVKEKNIPIEINMGRSRLGGWRPDKDLSKVEYPCFSFWKMAGEMGLKAFIGPDAHMPHDLYYGPFERMEEIAKKSKISLVHTLNLSPLPIGAL